MIMNRGLKQELLRALYIEKCNIKYPEIPEKPKDEQIKVNF